MAVPGARAQAEAATQAPSLPGVEQLALQSARTALGAQHTGARIEVVPGTLDPRLKLAPCARIEPYLPAGQRAWGRTRIGLRCLEGAVAWNVFLPVTVKVFAPTLVTTQALPAGTVLGAEHLTVAEADLTAADSPALRQAPLAIGRTLIHPLNAGAALREADLKRRQWFAVGDMVRIVAVGSGFSVSGEGTAVTPGVEGQSARVRTDSGRVVTGTATGERRLEVLL